MCRRYVLLSVAGFIYIKHIAGVVVENYSKSLQEFEDGITHVQLVISRNVNASVTSENDLHASHADFLPLPKK